MSSRGSALSARPAEPTVRIDREPLHRTLHQRQRSIRGAIRVSIGVEDITERVIETPHRRNERLLIQRQLHDSRRPVHHDHRDRLTAIINDTFGTARHEIATLFLSRRLLALPGLYRLTDTIPQHPIRQETAAGTPNSASSTGSVKAAFGAGACTLS